jgi:hypothetical protein
LRSANVTQIGFLLSQNKPTNGEILKSSPLVFWVLPGVLEVIPVFVNAKAHISCPILDKKFPSRSDILSAHPLKKPGNLQSNMHAVAAQAAFLFSLQQAHQINLNQFRQQKRPSPCPPVHGPA